MCSKERLPYTLAIHRGGANGENPHAHLMFSERGHDGIERDAEQWFRRYNRKAPGEGGARKSRAAKAGDWLEKKTKTPFVLAAASANKAATKVTLHPLMRNELPAIRVMTAWIICRCAILAASMPFLSSSVMLPCFDKTRARASALRLFKGPFSEPSRKSRGQKGSGKLP